MKNAKDCIGVFSITSTIIKVQGLSLGKLS